MEKDAIKEIKKFHPIGTHFLGRRRKNEYKFCPVKEAVWKRKVNFAQKRASLSGEKMEELSNECFK